VRQLCEAHRAAIVRGARLVAGRGAAQRRWHGGWSRSGIAAAARLGAAGRGACGAR
jgi:hypothetical protein